jgi:hypothetical protein
MLNELPKLRNRLLHQGELEVSTTNARAAASAVLTAIEWFFGTPTKHAGAGTTIETAQ